MIAFTSFATKALRILIKSALNILSQWKIIYVSSYQEMFYFTLFERFNIPIDMAYRFG